MNLSIKYKDMPLLKPNKNEKKEDFIKRFMNDSMMMSEYPEEKQRMAICEQQWIDANKNASYSERFENKDDMGGRIIDFDDSTGEVKTYINAFNIKDSQNDISVNGSFQKTFKENFKNIFWHINHDDNTMPGMTKELFEDSVGAIAIGKFNLKKQLGLDLFEDYKLFAANGRSLQHSVRVRPVKYSIQPDPTNSGEEVRKVSEWQMMEWSSLTKQGACPQTNVLYLKSESEIMQEINFLKEALNYKFSDDKLKTIEKQIQELQTLIKEAGLSTSKSEPSRAIDYNYLQNGIKNLKL